MGHKAHPIANRLGYRYGWEAGWFRDKKTFSKTLMQDFQIRKYLQQKMKRLFSKVVIERNTNKLLVITLHTAKSRIVIGTGGKKIQEIQQGLEKELGVRCRMNVVEIAIPEIDARSVAHNIASQIEAGFSCKRVAERARDEAMQAGAGGIRICISGRINGAEIARKIKFYKGRIPSQTLRAIVELAHDTALTSYGTIGVKVWIFHREVYGSYDLSPHIDTTQQRAPKLPTIA